MLDAPVRANLKMCQKLLKTIFLVQLQWSGPLKNNLYWQKRHIMLRQKCGVAYMKQDMNYLLFTDETRATLDGPDGLSKGWVGIGAKLQNHFWCHQAGGGVMLWARIINKMLIGPVIVLTNVKINSAAYCELLSEWLFPWLEDQSLSLRKKIMFIQDNVPSHSAKATQQYLALLWFKDNNFMIWPPNLPDLNPTDNFWSII